jgi:hypothetical protein
MQTNTPCPRYGRPDGPPLTVSRDRLRASLARLGGVCDWRVDSAGWVVTLYLPRERSFFGPTLEAALAACVAWLAPAQEPEPSRAVRPRDTDDTVSSRASA